MTYDIENYRYHMIPIIENWFRYKPEADKLKEISLIALSTDCPIVVVGHLMLEILGEDDKLLEKVKMLEKFYRIGE